MTPRKAEFRPIELGLSAVFAVAMLAAAALSLHQTVGAKSPTRAVDPAEVVPVRVVDMSEIDAPLLKLGGKVDRSKLPDRVVKPHAVARAEEKSFASTKASKQAEDIPPPNTPLADPKTPPPPKDAEVTKRVDTPVVEVDAGAPAVSSTAGHADGVKEGTETDPLKARAVDLYRARIASWFSSRFGVHGSGLAKEELTRTRVHASVHIGAGHVVLGYSITPSGNGAFDGAARAALESSKGQVLPPPPENYPDIEQADIHVTFVCRENRCD